MSQTYMELKSSSFNGRNLAIDLKRIRPDVLQNIESLVFTVFPDIWQDFHSLLLYLPTIKALSFRCAVYPIPSSEDLHPYISQVTEF